MPSAYGHTAGKQGSGGGGNLNAEPTSLHASQIESGVAKVPAWGLSLHEFHVIVLDGKAHECALGK